jgi:hypothetical protein
MNPLRMLNIRVVMVIGAAISLGLGYLPNAFAVPPDKTDFGPVQVFGQYVGGCDTFSILTDYTYGGHVIVHYDQGGNVTKVFQHYSFTEVTYYNSNFPEVLVRGGPGETQNSRFIYTGDSPFAVLGGPTYKITLPGEGVIFHQTGRLVVDLSTFEIIVQTGPSDFLDGNFDALCAALTP